MAGIFYTLGLKTGEFDQGIDRAKGGVDSLDSNTKRAGGGMSSLAVKAGALAASLGVASAAAVILRKSIAAAADLESKQVTLEVLLGGEDKAKAVIGEVRKFATETTFEIPGLIETATQLIGANGSAAGLRDEMLALGNIAANAGSEIEEISSIYTKVLNKGKFMAETWEQLNGHGSAGTAIVKKLAEQYGKTKEEVLDMMAAGEVGAEDFRGAVNRLAGAGGDWGELMKRQNETTLGGWKNLKSEIGEIFIVIGQPVNDLIRPMLQEAVQWAKSFGLTLKLAIDIGRNAAANADIGEIIFRMFQVGTIKAASAFLGLFEGVGQMAGNLATIVMDNLPEILGGNGKKSSVNILDGIDFSGAQTKNLLGLDLAQEALNNAIGRNLPDATAIAEQFEDVKNDAEAASDAIRDAADAQNGGRGAGGFGGGGQGAEGSAGEQKGSVSNYEESLRGRFNRMSKADKEKGGFENFYDYLGFDSAGMDTGKGAIGAADRGALEAMRGKGESAADQIQRLTVDASQQGRGAVAAGGLGGRGAAAQNNDPTPNLLERIATACESTNDRLAALGLA